MKPMTPSSSGLLGFSMPMLYDLVNWWLSGFPKPIPDGVTYAVVGLLAFAGHAGYNYLRNTGRLKLFAEAPADQSTEKGDTP